MQLKYTMVAFVLVLSVQSCVSNKDQDPGQLLKQMSASADSQIGSEDYRFRLPAGWNRMDTILQGNKITLILKEGDVLQPIVNVTNEFMRGKDHNRYVQDCRQTLINDMADIRLLNEGRLEVSGRSCIWFTYTRSQHGVEREMAYYSIAHKGVSCNITAGVNAGGLRKYKPTFDEMVQSLRVGDQ